MNNRCTLLLIMLNLSGMVLLGDGKKLQGDSSESMTPAQLQARDEMNALRPLAESITYDYFSPDIRKEAQKVYVRAMRAWNLDPMNEEAAYYVCWSNPANYVFKDKSNGVYSSEVYKQTDEFCKKYLDFFGQRNEQHHYEICLQRQICLRGYGTPKEQYEIFLKLVMLELKYPQYARASCPHGFIEWLEYISGKMSSDELQQAYPIWQKFITETYNPFLMQRDGTLYKEAMRRGSCPELLEATYWAHMKEPLKARAAITKAASIYPKDMENSWRSPFCKTSEATIASILRIAGDSEWQTWQPKFTTKLPPASSTPCLTESIREYFKRNHPQPPTELTEYFPVKEKLNVPIMEITIETGQANSHVSPIPIGIIGGNELLFISRPFQNYESSHTYVNLFRCPLNVITSSRSNKSTCTLKQIQWPQYPLAGHTSETRYKNYELTDYLSEKTNGKDVLWIGTRNHGLAKFTRNKSGEWDGRWFTYQNGLPEKTVVAAILPASCGGDNGILVSFMHDFTLHSGTDQWYNYFISEKTGKLIFLNKTELPCRIRFKDGKIIFFDNNPLAGRQNTYFQSSWNSVHHGANAVDYEYLTTHDISSAVFERKKYEAFPYSNLIKMSDDCYFYGGGIYNLSAATWRSGFCVNGWEFNGRWPAMTGGLMRRTGIISPLPEHGIIMPAGNLVCYMVCTKKKFIMMIWKPGNDSASPQINDELYGLYDFPSNLCISYALPLPGEKILLASLPDKLYLLDIGRAVKIAKLKNNVVSSQMLMENYLTLLQAGDWRNCAHLLIANNDQAAAVDFLDRKIRTFKSSGDNLLLCDAMMFKAAALSLDKKKYEAAIQLYNEVADITNNPGIAYLARLNMGVTCFFSGQYERCINILKKLPTISRFESSTFTDAQLDTQIGNSINNHADYFIKQAKEKVQKK